MDILRLLSMTWFVAAVWAIKLASARRQGETDDKASIKRARGSAFVGGVGLVFSWILLLYAGKRRGELEVTWSKAGRLALYSILCVALRLLLIDHFKRRPRGQGSG